MAVVTGREAEDDLLRGAGAMTAWTTGATAFSAAPSLLGLGPVLGWILVAASAACAAMAVAAYVRAARVARAWNA